MVVLKLCVRKFLSNFSDNFFKIRFNSLLKLVVFNDLVLLLNEVKKNRYLVLKYKCDKKH